MALPKFYVDVNPFTRVALVRAKIGKDTYESEVKFTLDSWASFSMGEETFDIQFNYDTELSVSVCCNEDYWLEKGTFPTKLTIKLKD